MTESLLVATRSAGKLRELRPLFANAGYAIVDLDAAGFAESRAEDAIESFETFEENALAKARYFSARSGLVTVADDSGLEVSALGGRPGVRSKRWSGRSDLSGEALDAANNARLVESLERVADLGARYVCAAACVNAQTEIVCRGETSGTIVLAPVGDSGFGYDPYFYSTELGCTFGEASVAAKEHVSHRGRAFRALLAEMRARAIRG